MFRFICPNNQNVLLFFLPIYYNTLILILKKYEKNLNNFTFRVVNCKKNIIGRYCDICCIVSSNKKYL